MRAAVPSHHGDRQPHHEQGAQPPESEGNGSPPLTQHHEPVTRSTPILDRDLRDASAVTIPGPVIRHTNSMTNAGRPLARCPPDRFGRSTAAGHLRLAASGTGDREGNRRTRIRSHSPREMFLDNVTRSRPGDRFSRAVTCGATTPTGQTRGPGRNGSRRARAADGCNAMPERRRNDVLQAARR